MNREEFAHTFDVSRETCLRLQRYLDLLSTWNTRINLVSKKTLEETWTRHFADSAQLLDLAPDHARTWIDLGSGAGFPGLPVAVIAAESRPGLRITMVESDQRKAAFMRAVGGELALDITVEAQRIESLKPRPYDVVSARALAPLDRLCRLAFPFQGAGTVFLFPKGAQVDSELTEARSNWHIRAERIPSRTHPEGTILKVVELEPRK